MVGEKRHQRLLYMKVEWRDAQRSPHTMYRYFGVGAPVFKLNRNRPGTNKKSPRIQQINKKKKRDPGTSDIPKEKRQASSPTGW
jgi:hypothetical protein